MDAEEEISSPASSIFSRRLPTVLPQVDEISEHEPDTAANILAGDDLVDVFKVAVQPLQLLKTDKFYIFHFASMYVGNRETAKPIFF